MAKSQTEMFEFEQEPIKGYPELRWAGKRPFTGTSYYPAQLKETHGEPSDDGWMNKIYWGDNLQVMSHLLKNFRGKINLICIDPPFDSKADYKKTIALRGQKIQNDSSNFEEKQYGDIWTNDEYLQFMYERLILCKELLSDTGSIYLHCDWHRNSFIRNVMNEIFGVEHFRNEIIWQKTLSRKAQSGQFGNIHDTIIYFSKTDKTVFNTIYEERDEEVTKKRFPLIDEKTKKRYVLDNFTQAGQGTKKYFGEKYGWLEPPVGKHWIWSQERIDEGLKNGMIRFTSGNMPRMVRYETEGVFAGDIWASNEMIMHSQSSEDLGYPTQKPEALLERIIRASSNPGDLIFDCFMGSGTTQAVAMKLGRRFIGADINLGAVQTTTKRLLKCARELQESATIAIDKYYTGFEVYNVNDYEFFRNELEAKKLIIEALGMQSLPENNLWDAEMDGRMVAILGINRIATASEFEKIVANIDISSWQKKQNENPGKPVEKITFVCMGHDPNLEAMFREKMASLGFVVDLEIIDILRDKKDLTFKRDSDAKISIANGKLSIEQFYPMNLLQKLSFEKQDVEDWKELVDSVMIDWNYDGVAFAPALTDIPEKNALVKGVYDVPEDAGTIHVKITDLISESWEGSFSVEGSKL